MNTIKSILTTLSIIISVSLAAQAPSIQWEKNYGGSDGDHVHAVQQTLDGGYIAVGLSASNDSDVTAAMTSGDLWVVKTDAAGNIQWEKSFGGSSYDYGMGVEVLADGSYVIAAVTMSNDSDVTGNNGVSDFWMVKIDGLGNLAWQKSYGGSNQDNIYALDQTSDGGFIAVGLTLSNDSDVTVNNGSSDIWVIKVDANGNLQWQKSLGGTASDLATSVNQVADGGYIIGGNTNSNDSLVSGNHMGWGVTDGWIVKLSATGNLLWQKCIGSTGQETVYDVKETFDGGLIAICFSNGDDGDVTAIPGNISPNYWLVKMDNAGTILWQKEYGGTNQEIPARVEQTPEGGYAVIGYTVSNDGDVVGQHGSPPNADIWMIKTTATGTLLWQRCLGGSANEDGLALAKTADGGFIVGGYSISNDGDVAMNYGGDDYWLVKINSDLTGIENLTSEKRFTIYPNPSSELIFITAENEIENYSWSIFNEAGQLVLNGIGKNTSQISIESLAAGFYTLQINSAFYKLVKCN